MPTDGARAGAVRLRRLVAVVVPAALGALGLVLAIGFGWISVAVASVHPLDISTTAGTADRLTVALGSDAVVSGREIAERPRAVAVVRLDGASMEDLCLVPRFDVPVIGSLLSLKITSGDRVRISKASLAAGPTTLGGAVIPATVIGGPAGRDGAPDSPGGFSIKTDGDAASVRLDDAVLATYGLTLEDGIGLRSLMVRPRWGDQTC